MSFLQVKNVSLQFGTRSLFENFSMDVHPGDFIVLTAENGKGKTSFIRGLFSPKVFCSGSITWGLPLAEVSYIPQLMNIEAHAPFTLLDAIQLHSKTSIQHILDLNLLSKDQLYLLWNQASGGEKKKTLFMAAFLCQPKLIILDEPFNHLDQVSVPAILSNLKYMQKEKKAILMVTHQLNHYSDHVKDFKVVELP